MFFMSDRFKFLYTAMLITGDILALLASFTVAYILRVTLGDTDPAVHIGSMNFIKFVALLLPLWVILFYFLGLYDPEMYERKRDEVLRLMAASVIGIMMMISASFMLNEPLFPAKLVIVYSLLVGVVLLVAVRRLIKYIRYLSFKFGFGLQKVVLVGNEEATKNLANYFHKNPSAGYQLIGIVANKKFIPKGMSKLQFKGLEKSIESLKPDLIIHTDMQKGDRVYNLATKHHVDYFFIPDHEAFITTSHETKIIGGLPSVAIKTTPLSGYGRVIKRLTDILGGLTGIILSSPIWIIVMIAQKISEPKAPVFYGQKRYTRRNKVVTIYKFRSMGQEFGSISPQEAFKRMGRPDLIKEYEENEQALENDPRVTKIGKFIRKTSIDELPQFINVLRGDISLVGPRALPLRELDNHRHKGVILSVKSGLTGLAQVSGRRDISFEERRLIDVYYVNNWSLLLDIQIIFKTIWQVLARKGAV